jgi:hypothetical protein
MSDVNEAVSIEEATDQALESVQDQPIEQTSFLDLDFDDGEKLSFKDADEAKQWAKDATLRHRDYTQKTQSLAEQRRQWEQERREAQERQDREMKAFEQLKSRYDRYEEAFKKRPQILQQLERMASQPANPDEIVERSQGYADEKYEALKSELDELKAEREREALERQRDEIYADLGSKYPDFNKDAVNRVLDELEEGNLKPLLDIAYRASRFNPEGVEEAVKEKLQRKQPAAVLAGGGEPPPPKTGSTNLDKAYEQALEAFAGEDL